VTYVDGLKAMVKGYIVQLRVYQEFGEPIVDEDEIRKLFLNVEELLVLHSQLLKDLQKLKETGGLRTSELGLLMSRYAPRFLCYIPFMLDFEDARKRWDDLRERQKFDLFVNVQEKLDGARVSDLLILPVQRVPRYMLLLKAIANVTNAQDQTFTAIQKALSDISQTADAINSSFKKREEVQRMQSIRSCLDGDETIPAILMKPGQKLVFDGALLTRVMASGAGAGGDSSLGEKEKDCWFLLFADHLFITKPPSNLFGIKLDQKGQFDFLKEKATFKVLYHTGLDGLVVEDDPGGAADSRTFLLQEQTMDITRTYVLQAPSVPERVAWFTKFQGLRS